jgi:hypothetical protein
MMKPHFRREDTNRVQLVPALRQPLFYSSASGGGEMFMQPMQSTYDEPPASKVSFPAA